MSILAYQKNQNMRSLILLATAILVFGITSCSKDDESEKKTYTIKYEVKSTGDVTIDTIQYMDSDNQEVTLIGQENFSHSFTSITNYHAKLYVSGITNNGNCEYEMSVLNEGDVIGTKMSNTESTSPVNFSWMGELQHTED